MKTLKNSCVILLVCLMSSVYAIAQQQNKKKGETNMNRVATVVFVCEHGSAKSVVAAAHFNKLARKKNLKIRAVSRATNPDEEIPANVANGLKADGLTAGEPKPKKLSQSDLAKAARVVTFCELPEDYSPNGAVEDWSDVPPISENYGKSRDEIVIRLKRLLDDLKPKKIQED